MATNYGQDSYCLNDILLIDTQVTDPIVLIGQRLARRLTTPRGALAAVGDDPDQGWDCLQYVNAKLTSAQITIAQAQIQAECLKDEEVLSAAVRMTFSGNALTIAISGTSSQGPFNLTVAIDQLTVQLIFGTQ